MWGHILNLWRLLNWESTCKREVREVKNVHPPLSYGFLWAAVAFKHKQSNLQGRRCMIWLFWTAPEICSCRCLRWSLYRSFAAGSSSMFLQLTNVRAFTESCWNAHRGVRGATAPLHISGCRTAAVYLGLTPLPFSFSLPETSLCSVHLFPFSFLVLQCLWRAASPLCFCHLTPAPRLMWSLTCSPWHTDPSRALTRSSSLNAIMRWECFF